MAARKEAPYSMSRGRHGACYVNGLGEAGEPDHAASRMQQEQLDQVEPESLAVWSGAREIKPKDRAERCRTCCLRGPGSSPDSKLRARRIWPSQSGRRRSGPW